MGTIQRITEKMTVNIAESAALSTEIIDFTKYSGGIVMMPAAWTAADIGFQVAGDTDDTFLVLKDHDNAFVVIDGPAADLAFEIPPEVFAARFVKLWSTDGAGAGTNQAAARVLTVLLKS